MSKEYSKSEVEKIWKKTKPTRIEELKDSILAKGASSLYPELDLLKNEIKELQDRVERLEMEKEMQEVMVKTFSPEKTKEMVANYLKEKGEAFPSDIADELGVSILDVIKALKTLEKEKKVGEAK
jgi:hypothetical protein